MPQTIHVFSGYFSSKKEATSYSEQQWEEPAPDETWTEEAYTEWENRNPIWALDDDLGVDYMDSDFIETIRGDDRLDYLKTQITDNNARSNLLEMISDKDNTLILIMSTAFDGKQVSLSPTSKLNYHGEYKWNVAAL